jgi:hypothetical protein
MGTPGGQQVPRFARNDKIRTGNEQQSKQNA